MLKWDLAQELDFLNIQKSINVIYPINNPKKTDHIILSNNAQVIFEKKLSIHSWLSHPEETSLTT